MKDNNSSFAPKLYLTDVAAAIAFFKKAFGAKELRRWKNADGSVHVAEMSVNGAMFHLHEEVQRNRELSPLTLNGTCVILGLFTEDPDALMQQAIAAGATTIHPMQDYDYGYRQGSFTDPFGHHWTVQKNIG